MQKAGRLMRMVGVFLALLAAPVAILAAGETHFDSSIKLVDSVSIFFGTDNDYELRYDGTDLDLLLGADDAVIKVGTGTNSADVWLYGNAAADRVLFDASANDLDFDGVDISLNDSDILNFGDANDVQVRWDATDLDVLAAANNSIIKLGDGTTSFDIWIYGAAAANYVLWDASANDLIFQDSTSLMFGTGSDVEMRWDATDLDVLAAADDSVLKIGNGTNSFDVWTYGNAATDYLLWDASAGQFTCTGTATIEPKYRNQAKTASYSLTPGDLNTVLTTRGAGAAVSFSLPDPAAGLTGAWVLLINAVNQNMDVVVAGQIADKIICFNDADADKVSFETTNELIGASLLMYCDGTSWFALPLIFEAVTITVTS